LDEEDGDEDEDEDEDEEKQEERLGDDADVARNRRCTTALKEALQMIRVEQRSPSGEVFAFSSISMLLLELGQDLKSEDLKSDLLWEANACAVVYYLLEAYMVTLLQNSNVHALEGGRVFIMPKDLQLARKIRTKHS